ncbi:oxidoreductase [Ktedonobacter racemifer]|uniref:Short-chain dehydrogenase/reductase SDR n=1 Tax=Ktedonobacter racemifer DSM 44963 TaxID=485913 RepID=D6U110_KTERA|nr:oxidoreductase [Ktedonobacter racemifer]EFH82500.1 short-chain dehydrogenase/reductase SDR [Ktedonobacter racemifer DSM 44963]
MSQWTTNDIPDLRGKVALVTGGNSGLGKETVQALAARGAHVILAARNPERGEKAREEVLQSVPDASIKFMQLDLASQAAIREFAASFLETHQRLDLLFNNAGVMAIPRHETKDGFEMQFGTNHLGHFALTGLLLPLLLATPKSRVVTTSSMARAMGRVNLDDLQSQKGYTRWSAYGQSKRANLLFAFELQRRLAATSTETISVAAHPGYAHTNLQSTSATLSNSNLELWFYEKFGAFVGQPAAMGALPQLYAGLSSDIHGGELVGPGGFSSMRGHPRVETKAQREYDRPTAERLWDASIELTGVDYAQLQQNQPSSI